MRILILAALCVALMTPTQAGRYAALVRWSKEDPHANAVRGQRGLRAKFLREVEAEAQAKGEVLTEAEKYRRAECAFRAHMSKIRANRKSA